MLYSTHMATVPERCREAAGRHVFICDFSPPRAGDAALMDDARTLQADFISVAYNPGRSVRVNSALGAQWVQTNTRRDAIFTIATRDMNQIAIQSLLLGAQLAGLENVVVVQGDPMTEKDRERTKAVDDISPTQLIAAINEMNDGVDFRGSKLRAPTRFAVGATIDLHRDMAREVELAHRKVQAGAAFFLLQAIFDPHVVKQFQTAYAKAHGPAIQQPLFCGVQVMVPDGIVFGDTPEWVKSGLASGRSGADMALDLIKRFGDEGFTNIYLVPPILKGGARDYDAARRVLAAFGR